MPPAPACAAGTPAWRPRGHAQGTPFRLTDLGRRLARRPEQRRDHAISAGDVTHHTPLAINQHDPSIRHGYRWRPRHRPQRPQHTLRGATDTPRCRSKPPGDDAAGGRGRRWRAAGGVRGQPARLGRTVGTSSYRCSVITRETAAEPAPARIRRPLDEIDFVIVDVETTGWTPGEARITEIGAVRISGKPPAGAVLVAGQSRRRDSRGGSRRSPASATRWSRPRPRWAEVLPAFLAFARGGVLTAHNAPFDVGFLMAACQACGLPWPDFPVVDTVELARWVLGEDEVPNCKLSTLAAFFGARTTPRHRALADALATADVLHGPAAQALRGRCRHARRDARRPGPRRGGGPGPRPWMIRAVRRVIRAVSGGSPRRAVRYRRWLGIGARGGRRGHRDRPGEPTWRASRKRRKR